ncbi:hypothetical protein FE257_005118 [Aspergillus nanangensis]|uniref:Uncharacterized protein n=1 Tax=Aspergillus nanangensis TaxID=2582783 RepID=A0AAD4CAF2_ASPNN|nr:hypothetical protein FE257_005118 [Aspergillus nanangensis]
MPSTSFLNECRSYDYVLGKNLLLTFISTENANEADPSIAEGTFEAAVNQTFETFGYEKVLRGLNDELSGSSDNVQDPKKGLLGTFGFLHRTMSKESFIDITKKWVIPEIRALQAHASGLQGESSSTSRDETSPHHTPI